MNPNKSVRAGRLRACLAVAFAAAIFGISWQPGVANAAVARLHAIERVLGLHETKNRSTIQKMVGVNPATTPWCGAAAAYAVRKAGGTPVQYPNKAVNWTKFGVSVPLSAARQGDIVVFRFKRGHHVAVFKGHAGDGRITACGGNMSNSFKCSNYRASSVVAVRR